MNVDMEATFEWLKSQGYVTTMYTPEYEYRTGGGRNSQADLERRAEENPFLFRNDF